MIAPEQSVTLAGAPGACIADFSGLTNGTPVTLVIGSNVYKTQYSDAGVTGPYPGIYHIGTTNSERIVLLDDGTYSFDVQGKVGTASGVYTIAAYKSIE